MIPDPTGADVQTLGNVIHVEQVKFNVWRGHATTDYGRPRWFYQSTEDCELRASATKGAVGIHNSAVDVPTNVLQCEYLTTLHRGVRSQPTNGVQGAAGRQGRQRTSAVSKAGSYTTMARETLPTLSVDFQAGQMKTPVISRGPGGVNQWYCCLKSQSQYSTKNCLCRGPIFWRRATDLNRRADKALDCFSGSVQYLLATPSETPTNPESQVQILTKTSALTMARR